MSRIGKNLKLSIASTLRDKVHLALEQGLGATCQPYDTFDIFKLDHGCSVGVFYIAEEKALTPDQYYLAPWLEFEVEDEALADERLTSSGVERVPFSDLSHRYYRLPGGPVFRIARAQ